MLHYLHGYLLLEMSSIPSCQLQLLSQHPTYINPIFWLHTISNMVHGKMPLWQGHMTNHKGMHHEHIQLQQCLLGLSLVLTRRITSYPGFGTLYGHYMEACGHVRINLKASNRPFNHILLLTQEKHELDQTRVVLTCFWLNAFQVLPSSALLPVPSSLISIAGSCLDLPVLAPMSISGKQQH